MTQLLEEAIKKVKRLDPDQQDDIAAVILAEIEQSDWDKQIEQDLRSGKLDKLIKKVREDIASGRSEPI